MIKKDLAQLIRPQTGMQLSEATVVVDQIFNAMAAALRAGEEIEIRGFGVFRFRTRAASKHRNPRTGNIEMRPARKILYFKPGKLITEPVKDDPTQ